MSFGTIKGQIATTEGPRRGEPRLQLSFPAGIQQGEDVGNAQILNISRTGLLLETQIDLSDNQPITIALPGIEPRRAQIVWISGRLVGCRFDKPLRRADLADAKLRNDGPSESEPEPIGLRIKQRREEAGLSMVRLAQILGVSKPTVWKWETGRMLPSQQHFRGLCQALNIPELELAYGVPNQPLADRPGDPDRSAPSLAEAIANSRKLIAAIAGVDEESVSITISAD